MIFLKRDPESEEGKILYNRRFMSAKKILKSKIFIISVLVVALSTIFYFVFLEKWINHRKASAYIQENFRNNFLLGDIIYGDKNVEKDVLERVIMMAKLEAGIEDDIENWMFIESEEKNFYEIGSDYLVTGVNCFENKENADWRCIEKVYWHDSDYFLSLASYSIKDADYANANEQEKKEARDSVIASSWFPLKSRSYGYENGEPVEEKLYFFWNGDFDRFWEPDLDDNEQE